MTKPGVQKPHCEAWVSTIACWTGCRPSPSARSSTVNNALPPSWATNRMQASTARYRRRPSTASPITTVQAPQSPSAQPSLLPVRRSRRRRYSSTVMVWGTSGPTVTTWPRDTNLTGSDMLPPVPVPPRPGGAGSGHQIAAAEGPPGHAPLEQGRYRIHQHAHNRHDDQPGKDQRHIVARGGRKHQVADTL